MMALQQDMIQAGNSAGVKNARNRNMSELSNTGAFRVESIRAASAVENFTKALQKQEVTFRQLAKSGQLRNDVLKEQYRISKMSVIGWSQDGNGAISADMIIPREVPERLGSWKKSIDDVIRGKASLKEVLGETNMRLGLMNQELQSASRNMINWGKNTQWAGRQMMVGLTIPMVAFAAASGAMAYEVDKELTRILKVYDYATDNMAAEGERIRDISMQTANEMSRMYGQSAKDTAGIIADLAATGKTGTELQQSAMLVSRASMLGELDRADAIKTTISLQTVFNQNTQQLGETFDYLNALENATSLSMRDMTVAIPKLSGVVQALGGDYRDMGLMMAASKSAGIEAAEGANMLKTVMFRAVSPYGKGKETFLDKTKVDLSALVASTNGEAIPTFLKMGKAMERLSNPDRAAVLKDVFGVYQGSKAGQFLSELAEMNDETTQTYAAAQVNMKSAGELAQIAANEVARQQESISGRFKIALETIKTEMAEVGEPFLKVATSILGGLAKIVAGFNGLSDTSKQIILWGLALAGIVGPITMITGVVFTLIGTGIKAIAMLTSLGATYRATTSAQAAQMLLQKQSIVPFHDQATAAFLLSEQLKNVNRDLQNLAGQQALAAATSRRSAVDMGKLQAQMVTMPEPTKGRLFYDQSHPTKKGQAVPNSDVEYRQKVADEKFYNSLMVPGADGKYRYPKDTPDPKGGKGLGGKILKKGDLEWQARAARDAELLASRNKAAAASLDDLDDGLTKTRRGMGGFTGTTSAAAGALLMMTGSTNKFVNSLSIGLMALPLLVPLVQKIAGMGIFATWGVKALEFAGVIKTKVIPGLVTARTVAGTIGAALMGPLGWGLAAAGAALAVLYIGLKKTRQEAEDLANAGEGIMKAINVVPLQQSKAIEDTKTGQLDKFRRTEKGAAKALDKMGNRYRETGDDTELKNRVIQIGLEVYDATGDVNKAKQAIDVAMASAGMADGEIDIRFIADEAGIRDMRQQVSNALVSSAVENDKTGWSQIIDFGVSEAQEKKIEAEAKRLNQMFSQVQAGLVDPDVFKKELERVQDTFVNGAKKIVDGYMGEFSKEEIAVFEKFKIDPKSQQQVAQGLLTNVNLVKSLRAASIGGGVSSGILNAEGLDSLIDNNTLLNETYRESVGLHNTGRKGINDLTTVHESFAGAANDTTKSIKSLGDENGATTESFETMEQAVDSARETFDEMKDAARGIMEETSSAIFDRAADEIEGQHDATINKMEADSETRLDAIESEAKKRNAEFEAGSRAMDKRHSQQDKGFDKDWDARTKLVEKGYDDRVKAIETTMKAEEKAEAMRQKMFEAEKARISRLAEMYNQNVDFNVALNSGDLDEAAKLTNNMRAQEQQWGLEDAEALSGTAAEQRREKQQAEIDKIGEAKDVRLEALKEEQEAAKALLDERQQAEKDALSAEKERYAESVAARKEAEKLKTDDAVAGAKKRFEAEKESLELALAAEKKFIPATQAELVAHTARIQAIYEDHGFQLDMASDEWSSYVASAMQSAGAAATAEMANTARWGELGKGIGGEIAEGLLGMTFPEFLDWMRTGIVPKENKKVSSTIQESHRRSEAITKAANAGKVGSVATNGNIRGQGGWHIRHAGGPIGVGDRAGRPLNAGLYQDEYSTILQKGEFVVRKKIVDQFGVDALTKMNNGDAIPQKAIMHNGGLVGGVGGVIQAALTQGLEAAMFMGASNNIRNSGAMLPPTLSAFMASGQQIAGVPQDKRATIMDQIQADFAGLPGGFMPGSYQLASPYKYNGGTVTGDVQGLSMEFIRRLASWSGAVGKPYNVGSGYRNMQEQARLYARYRAGVPGQAPAAAPGSSNHNFGLASDGPHWGGMNPGRFGLRYPMSYEPWHVEPNNARGMRTNVPGLKIGGDIRYDNTIANLHKDEKVLTAPLSKQLERGIGNLDSGGAVKYDIHMDLRGAMIREDVDVERAVEKVINAHESRLGRKRVVGDKS